MSGNNIKIKADTITIKIIKTNFINAPISQVKNIKYRLDCKYKRLLRVSQ